MKEERVAIGKDNACILRSILEPQALVLSLRRR